MIAATYLRPGAHVRAEGWLCIQPTGPLLSWQRPSHAHTRSDDRQLPLVGLDERIAEPGYVRLAGQWTGDTLMLTSVEQQIPPRDPITANLELLRSWLEALERERQPAPLLRDKVDELERRVCEMQDRGLILSFKQLTLRSGERVTVASSTDTGSVRAQIGEYFANGYLILVSSRWGSKEIERAEAAIGQLGEQMILSSGQALNDRGELTVRAHVFTHDERLSRVQRDLPDGILKVYTWLQTFPVSLE